MIPGQSARTEAPVGARRVFETASESFWQAEPDHSLLNPSGKRGLVISKPFLIPSSAFPKPLLIPVSCTARGSDHPQGKPIFHDPLAGPEMEHSSYEKGGQEVEAEPKGGGMEAEQRGSGNQTQEPRSEREREREREAMTCSRVDPRWVR